LTVSALLVLDIPYFIERKMLKHQLRRGSEVSGTCILHVHKNLANGRSHGHERKMFRVSNMGCQLHSPTFPALPLPEAIKRPRTRSAAARQVSNAHERDLVTNQIVEVRPF